jgi:hypothetical protein
MEEEAVGGVSGVGGADGTGSVASGVNEASLEKLCDPLYAKIGKLSAELD